MTVLWLATLLLSYPTSNMSIGGGVVGHDIRMYNADGLAMGGCWTNPLYEIRHGKVESDLCCVFMFRLVSIFISQFMQTNNVIVCCFSHVLNVVMGQSTILLIFFLAFDNRLFLIEFICIFINIMLIILQRVSYFSLLHPLSIQLARFQPSASQCSLTHSINYLESIYLHSNYQQKRPPFAQPNDLISR